MSFEGSVVFSQFSVIDLQFQYYRFAVNPISNFCNKGKSTIIIITTFTIMQDSKRYINVSENCLYDKIDDIAYTPHPTTNQWIPLVPNQTTLALEVYASSCIALKSIVVLNDNQITVGRDRCQDGNRLRFLKIKSIRQELLKIQLIFTFIHTYIHPYIHPYVNVEHWFQL